MAGAGASTARSLRSGSRVEAARTSNACQACRDKKVKCSGQQPCKYCAKRHLNCVFTTSEKRRLFSISQIRELEDKVAFYEGQREREALSPPSSSATGNAAAVQSQDRASCLPEGNGQTQSPHSSSSETRQQGQRAAHRPVTSPGWQSVQMGSQPCAGSVPPKQSRAIAPESALSSSETFGAEVKTLLVSRSNPGSADSVSASGPSPIPQIDRRGLEASRCWPSEEEAHSMLEVVVLNVGISQQMFDAREFSNNLSLLYQDTNGEIQLPELWRAEMLLVFAIGRMLQARPDENGDLPGTGFFQEAMKRMPVLTDLRKHGLLGVEVVGLAGMYLQIADRNDEAYLQANMALRLAISHGFHRASNSSSRQRSENVHRNRLWWSLYMQERRLCVTGGYPMSIGDYAINAWPPYDAAGYPSATPISVNVRTARVTGQIISTIYSHKEEAESVFVTNVQNILRSLHDIETGMPAEFSMSFNPSGLVIAGLPFGEINPTAARTSSSLYISVYSAVIHTVRPILLYMARHSRDPEPEASHSEVSPALRRLAEICVEAASKTLLILQHLRRQEILAKHAFLDLDATFSVGFIFVLVEAINPGKGLGYDGIEGSREVLGYQVRLGNQAAAKRLHELDTMCATLPVQHRPMAATPLQASPQSAPGTGVLTQPFSFDNGYGPSSNMDYTMGSDLGGGPAVQNQQHQVSGNGAPPADQYDQPGLYGADLASIPLEGENGLYWVYHNPGLPFTGVEQTDWEALESQLLWTNPD